MASFATGKLNIDRVLVRWAVEFSATLVDQQDRVAGSLLEQQTPGFTVFDISAYALLFENVMATAGVKNLTDEFYFTHFDTRRGASVFQPGVNFYFGTQLTY